MSSALPSLWTPTGRLQSKRVRELIATIAEDAWTAIKYPKAIWDKDEERWVSDAEVAEVEYPAFTGKAKKYLATARLLVRRVRRLGDAHVPDGQGELFKAYGGHISSVYRKSHTRWQRPVVLPGCMSRTRPWRHRTRLAASSVGQVVRSPDGVPESTGDQR
ncbi:hypothetical protein ACWC9T_11250 [Kitasatospora sp. NPDC001159]